MKIIIVLLACFLMFSCKEKSGFDDLTTYSKNGNPHFVISNQSGTTTNYIYDKQAKGFKAKTVEGRLENIPFLPFPANFGFFPSTHDEKGNLIKGFLISEPFSIQTLVEVKPIAAMEVEFIDGSREDILILVTEEEKYRSVNIQTLSELSYGIRDILHIWYENVYPGSEISGWKDENYALELIKSRSKR